MTASAKEEKASSKMKKSLLLLHVAALLSCPWRVEALAGDFKPRRQRPSRRNQDAYARRKSGFRTKRKRTPRWETEGDALYQEIHAPDGNALSENEARIMLAPLENVAVRVPAKRQSTAKPETGKDSSSEDSSSAEKKVAPPHTLWGSLPVGPVIKNRLSGTSFQQPTPVQSAAFSAVSKGSNTVIASPTGTGKTLAFLLPLLATRNRKLPCGILIVTPSVELAQQIQRQVDMLWPPIEEKGAERTFSKSACRVVGQNQHDMRPDGDSSDEIANNQKDLLCHDVGEAAILAGTPRMLRDLLAECKEHTDDSRVEQVSKYLQANLRTIILDEADRLLRTEGKARDSAQPTKGPGTRQCRPSNPTQTEVLLSTLPVPISKLQIICASATVGRTLRRQLMDILQTPSIEKAATLITADGRATGKDIENRRASLVPGTITHKYRLVGGPPLHTKDETHERVTAALVDTLKGLPPAPTLIFPGRVGAELVRRSLAESSLQHQNLLSLEDLSKTTGTHGHHNASTFNMEEKYSDWKDTPVYVIPNKFGRGLDPPNLISNVILLSPPSSAAGYAHLAGRTGRNGCDGTVITLVLPKDASRLVTISGLLVLPFFNAQDSDKRRASGGSEVKGESKSEVVAVTQELPRDNDTSWACLSDSALKRKTVADLKEYLASQVGRGVSVEFYSERLSLTHNVPVIIYSQDVDIAENAGRKVLKADLLAAVKRLQKT